MVTELIRVENLVKHFPVGGGLFAKPTAWVKAVNGVSISVRSGESFGVVGESGCGKTTLGQMMVRLLEPTQGVIYYNDTDITHLSSSELRPFRQKLQIIFQDPYSSLDPRMKVADIVTEPLVAQGEYSKKKRHDIAADLIKKVGLQANDLKKFPHEFSGGQRQRIGIARALCVRPELIVADEPVSALDVSIQAQVINLMADLKDAFDLSYLFISHDISVVDHICDRIAVMYLGTIIEIAPTHRFMSNRRHPYSAALLAAIPAPDPHRRIRPAAMEGDVPNPIDPPLGCPFHPRCAYVMSRCRIERPSLVKITADHAVACWLNDGHGMDGGGQ